MQLDHADPTQPAFPGPPKLSDNCRWRFLFVFSSLAVLLLAAIACDNDSTWRPAPGLSGYVRLENQSDHSGVLLTIAELDSTAVTDSRGFFSFGGIPDGSWQIEARLSLSLIPSDSTSTHRTAGDCNGHHGEITASQTR
jgi:hypothetical protein